MESSRYSGTLEKALKVLQLFDVERNELGITEISKLLRTNKSTIHRLVATFEKYGYLTKNIENDKYSLGLETYRLGQIATEKYLIKKWGDAHLPELLEIVQENVQMGMLNGLEVVHIAHCEGPKKLNFKFPIHKKAPACCIAMGKILLAYNEVPISSIVGSPLFKMYTSKTIIDIVEYQTELKRVYEQGFAIDDEEYEEGVRCIAMPVFDFTGKAIAAVSVSAPVFRMTTEKIENVKPALKKATEKISIMMGYKA